MEKKIFEYLLDEGNGQSYLARCGNAKENCIEDIFDYFKCIFCDLDFSSDELNNKIKLYGLVSPHAKYIVSICLLCADKKLLENYLIINLNYDLDYIKANYKSIFEEFKKYELVL